MKSKNVYLMCPPEYFDVSYIINPWMNGNLRAIDNALAKVQWRALYDIVCDHATVRLALPQPGSPDMVFTANAGLVLDNKFIVSRFRYPERQYEEPYFADWFMDRGFEVMMPPRDIPRYSSRHPVRDRIPDTGEIKPDAEDARHHHVSELGRGCRPTRTRCERESDQDYCRGSVTHAQKRQRVGVRRNSARDNPARRPQEDEQSGCDAQEHGRG